MPPSILKRIQSIVEECAYDMTVHALEEMAEDDLDIIDVESALTSGVVARTETNDPRGIRYVIEGTAKDNETPVGVVARFVKTDRLLIITVYEISEKV